MDCKEAQILFVEHILGDLEPDSTECLELETHLLSCEVCSEHYEDSKETVKFIEDHNAEFAEAIEALEEKEATEAAEKNPMSPGELERSWRCIEAKLDRLEAGGKRKKRAKIRRILVKVSAAAACLAIGAFAWLMLADSTALEEPLAQQGALAPTPSIKIALLTETGRVAVAVGQAVETSAGELKTLIINGRHRTVMNADTSLSITPLGESKQPGCMVALDSGQICAHVEHDGDPFVVATAHGRAVITGTALDVKATQAGMTLVVAEGSVRFESRQGIVEVAAGQISEILANSPPTKPLACDAAKLTAWATGHEFKAALAKLEPYSDDYDLTGLWLSANSGSIELERIDYQGWIEEKRPWFQREFPWIFQLQTALAAEGIETDYPQLLISSGDIWQFAYPATSPQQIPIPYLDPMLKEASKYGFDEQWLTENIRAAKSAIVSPSAPEDRFTGPKAFEQWAACIEQMRRSSEPPDAAALLYSLHASVYLANTRTVAWLSLTSGELDSAQKDNAKVLALLQTEVTTATELTGRIIRLFAGVEDQPCDECRMLLNDIIENITTITEIEKGIKEHEGLK